MRKITLKSRWQGDFKIYYDADTGEPVIRHTYGFDDIVTNAYIIYKGLKMSRDTFLNFSSCNWQGGCVRHSIEGLVEAQVDDNYIYVRYNHPKYGWINKKIKFQEVYHENF